MRLESYFMNIFWLFELHDARRIAVNAPDPDLVLRQIPQAYLSTERDVTFINAGENITLPPKSVDLFIIIQPNSGVSGTTEPAGWRGSFFTEPKSILVWSPFFEIKVIALR